MKRNLPVYDWPLTATRIEQLSPGMARHWLRQLDLLRRQLPPVKVRKGHEKEIRITFGDPYMELRVKLAMSETDLLGRLN